MTEQANPVSWKLVDLRLPGGVCGLGLIGFRVQGLARLGFIGFRVWGSGFRVT